MRHAAVLAMLGLVSLTGAACGPRGPAPTPASRSATRPAPQGPIRPGAAAEDHPFSRIAREMLQKKRGDFEFRDDRFDSAIDYFRDVSGQNVVVNWPALQAAGIDKDATVSLKLSNVTHGRALKEILFAAGGVVPLGYILDEGYVRISTREDLSTLTTHRVYDVADLVAADTAQRRREKAEELCDVIRAAINRDSWVEYAGSLGSICELDGLLLVLQNDQNHARLAKLLSTIRRKLDERTAREKVKTAPGAPSVRPTATPPGSDANRAAMAKLQENRPKLFFTDVRFYDALDFFRDVTDLNLVVNWQALGDAGIDKGTAVSVTLHNVSNERALIETLSAAGGVVPLGYILDEGVIRVSTKLYLSTRTTVGVYDVEDLMAADTVQGRREKAETLADIFRGIFNHDSWVEKGGPQRWVRRPLDGLLLVLESDENHAQVAELLTTIRRTLDERAARAKIKTAPGASPIRPAAAADESEANRAAIAKLQENRPKLEFHDVRLDSTLGFFGDATGLNVVVNWGALQAAGIDKRTALTLAQSNVSNEHALKEILSVAGGKVPLGYRLEEGVVRISTREELSTWTTVRVYDVADMVAGDTGQRREEKVYKLFDIIRSAIDCTSWVEAGGLVGQLHEFDGLFVVSQTQENHARLAKLLTTIRRKLDERAARPANPAPAVGTP